jgi:hypothetical protein
VVKVRVEEPPAVTEAGWNAAVVPVGSPEALSDTTSVSPPTAAVEIVVVAEEP